MSNTQNVSVTFTMKDPIRPQTKLDVHVSITPDGILITPDDESLRWSKEDFERSVFVELYEGQLRALAWDGSQEDPNIILSILEAG